MFEKIKYSLANTLRSLLRIYPSSGNALNIQELLDFDTNVAVNKIWYRGDGYELKQLYEQIDDNSFSFWGARMTRGMEIRKIHTGLPKTMINILTGAICDDLQDVTFKDVAAESVWEEIAEENDFPALVKKCVSSVLVSGDGAFKISIDPNISDYPILEFYDADHIEVVYERGRVKEIVFKTPFESHNATYILREHYGHGYVTYELADEHGAKRDLADTPQTAGLQPITWPANFMLAEYISFYASDKYEGRGQSVFDAKRSNFDALDEAWSQWMDALRSGRTKTYIPENFIPRDPKSGRLMQANSFDNRFIQMAASTSETDSGKIVTESPTIQHDSYLASYVTALDLCLQGVISPSTLGIDTKKLDNAEAQREKEKATLYTRQTIVTALQKVLPALIQDIFDAYATMTGADLKDVGADVPFGEYANPSFESQVETVSKAKTGGIMSVKAAIDELYGDSRDDEWKAEELQRIYTEQGIVSMDEPAVSMDAMDGMDDAEINGMLDDFTAELDGYDMDDEQRQAVLDKLDALGGM